MQDKYIRGERLLDLRLDRDLILEDVAEGTGLSVATISRIETSEEKEPSIKTLCSLAKYYRVSTDYLLELSERKGNLSEEIPLRDEAVSLIQQKKFNNRILSDLIEHIIQDGFL